MTFLKVCNALFFTVTKQEKLRFFAVEPNNYIQNGIDAFSRSVLDKMVEK